MMSRTQLPLMLWLVLLLVPIDLHAEDSAKDTLLPFDEKNIVDFHVHVAGLGYGNSGCFINEEMRNNFRFKFFIRAMGVTLDELEKEGDKVLFKKISDSVSESTVISKVVILSMDGVINEQGDLDKKLTQIYVPNEYVHTQVQNYPNLLYAASINPYRKDAITLLEKAKADGAVLVKWIPSIMYIDPSDPAIIPFYKKMVELDIPLLTHTGMEKSFSHAKDELADPHRLELPLSLGVKVIAAHIATTGTSEGEDNFKRILPMFKKYPNLYADISSLTQVNKLGYLKKALKEPELDGRLIYGTDWPLQFFPIVSPWYHLDEISFSQAWHISRMRNQWDKDVALKLAMGLDKDVFYLGGKLFIKD